MKFLSDLRLKWQNDGSFGTYSLKQEQNQKHTKNTEHRGVSVHSVFIDLYDCF